MKMIYPCTFTKKTGEDGCPFWRGEQKQLDIVVEEVKFTHCVVMLEQTMKQMFRRMTGSNSMDHLIRCQQIAVKGVVSFKVPVNRTLSEFVQADNRDEETSQSKVSFTTAIETIVTAADGPDDWTPKNGGTVIYRKPAFAEECGVFVITDDNDLGGWNRDDEIYIAPIDDDDEGEVILEYLDNLAPSRIGVNELDVCKKFKEYQKQRFLDSIPSNDGNGGIADEQ